MTGSECIDSGTKESHLDTEKKSAKRAEKGDRDNATGSKSDDESDRTASAER
jgi:hypothetical protein